PHSILCLLYPSRTLRDLYSFPTRRSSDLDRFHMPLGECMTASFRRLLQRLLNPRGTIPSNPEPQPLQDERCAPARKTRGRTAFVDRKSTRLNSSHVKISYAVFCLKKKKKT